MEIRTAKGVFGLPYLSYPKIYMKVKPFFFALATASMIFAGCSSDTTSTTPSEEVEKTTSEVSDEVSKAASEVTEDLKASNLDEETKAKLDEYRGKAEDIYSNAKAMVQETLDDPAFEETKNQIKSDIQNVYGEGQSVFNEAYEKLSSDPDIQKSMNDLKTHSQDLYNLLKDDFDRSVEDNKTSLQEHVDKIDTDMKSFEADYNSVTGKVGESVSNLDDVTKAKLDDYKAKAEDIYNNARDMVEETLDDPAFEETKNQIKSDIETVYADGESVFNEAYTKLTSDPDLQNAMYDVKTESEKLYDLLKDDFDRSLEDNKASLQEHVNNITEAMKSFDYEYNRANNLR